MNRLVGFFFLLICVVLMICPFSIRAITITPSIDPNTESSVNHLYWDVSYTLFFAWEREETAGNLNSCELNSKISPHNFTIDTQGSYPDNHTVVSMKNFPMAFHTATAMEKDHRFTLKAMQRTGEINISGKYVPTYLYLYRTAIGNDGSINKIPLDSVVGTVNQDGSVSFDPDIAFACADVENEKNGIYHSFTINNDFIVPSGKTEFTRYRRFYDAVFTDGWLLPELKKQAQPPLVNDQAILTQNIDNPNQIILTDPYFLLDNAPYDGYTVSSGQIYIDMTDPECVLVMPGIWSGFGHYTVGVVQGGWPQDNYSMFNNEGFQYVYHGRTQDEIKNSRTVGNLSRLEGNKLYINNLQYYIDLYPIPSEIVNYYGEPTQTIIELPWEMVNCIRDVKADACGSDEVRYFNLQGVEIPHPSKGQLVIVKDGSVSSKRIF